MQGRDVDITIRKIGDDQRLLCLERPSIAHQGMAA